MVSNILFATSEEPGGDPFTSIGNAVVKNAKMSPAMWMVAVFDVIVLAFVLAYTRIPHNKEDAYLSSSDIKMILMIVLIPSVILLLAFGIKEIMSDEKK